MICLTAIGFTLSGSSTVHINTQTIRTENTIDTNNTKYTLDFRYHHVNMIERNKKRNEVRNV